MRCILIGIMFLSVDAFALDWNWNTSTYNYKNSKDNYENSEYNYKNSPDNWSNSQYNPERKSICNEEGQAIGYVVPKDDGGTNIFNNEGKRIGFTPSEE
jgi:sortase (surface protein transpeptidase)